jgi:uncharacterized membrane protein
MSGIVLALTGRTATSAPGAPTIGTATATGQTTATVVFTQPASDGGSVITSYTATSSPSGITGTLSQAGSGTITVSGLTSATSYTFTVTATNAIGTSAASAASNSITTFEAPPTVIGQAYGGGFYAGQIGVSSVATHYLVVSPKSTGSANLAVMDPRSSTSISTSDIDGPANTAAQIANNPTDFKAASFCDALSTGGYSDWYLGAINEQEVCYYNLKPTTASNNTSFQINPNAVPARSSNYSAGTPAQTSAAVFAAYGGAQYFIASLNASSTLVGYSSAKFKHFNYGQVGQYYKNSVTYVRALRRVAV